MSKYSDFEKIPRDFYPTPLSAVKPLLPHLPSQYSFWEPCAGDGALIDHLASNSGSTHCIASDIKKSGDIKSHDALCDAPLWFQIPDLIITNPPWTRKILHPMITKFSSIAPTWLLFDADWIHTQQSADFIPLLSKVVSVGRVKWFPESNMTGKINCAWHLFDAGYFGQARFYGRVSK